MSAQLTIPRSPTWETLQNSRNLAAIATLSTGLNSTNAQLRHSCVKALLIRKQPAACREILTQWEHFDDEDRDLIREHTVQFGGVARELLALGSLREKRIALEVISALELVDCLDELAKLTVDTRHPLSQRASECVMAMCTRMGQKARNGKDPRTERGKMLEVMHSMLVNFHKHKSLHLVDAWLCLVNWDDSLQRGLVADSRQDVYRPMMKRLAESDRMAIVQLLGGYLSRATTPKNVIAILTERSEPALALEIAKLCDARTLPGVLKRLQVIAPLQCLQNIESQMSKIAVDLERKLWLMAAASTDNLRLVLRGAVKQSKMGTREARATAAEMLRLCRRPDIETIVPALQALETQSSDTLEEASLGDLIRQIAGWLNSPSMALKKAAREFLKDFTIEHLLQQVRCWPLEMCKAMATIVALYESQIEEKLIEELQSPAPKRRLAALQATQLLECGGAVSMSLMPLLDDPKLDVRIRTIDLLAALGHETLEQIIPQLLTDASTDIQDAAGRAVRRMRRDTQGAAPE